jgi:hypothetical protein
VIPSEFVDLGLKLLEVYLRILRIWTVDEKHPAFDYVLVGPLHFRGAVLCDRLLDAYGHFDKSADSKYRNCTHMTIQESTLFFQCIQVWRLLVSIILTWIFYNMIPIISYLCDINLPIFFR